MKVSLTTIFVLVGIIIQANLDEYEKKDKLLKAKTCLLRKANRLYWRNISHEVRRYDKNCYSDK